MAINWSILRPSRIRFVDCGRAFVPLAVLLVCTAQVTATYVTIDTDPTNDSAVTADALPLLAAGTAVENRATLAAPDNDVDFFSVPLSTGEVLLGMTTPLATLPADFDTPDTMAGVHVGGVQMTFSDDDGAHESPDPTPGILQGSLFRYHATSIGTHHIAVTGFDDFEFDGDASGDTHTETGDYIVTAGRVDPTVLGGGFTDTDTAGANDTTATTPDVIPLTAAGGASVAVSELDAAGSDIDFYQISLLAGQVLSAMTAPLSDLPMSFDVPDTMLGLFNSSGTLIFFNDDAGDSNNSSLFGTLDSDSPSGDVFGSAIRALIMTDGIYYIGVTGFGDDDFEGSHSEIGRYALLVGVTAIPEASAAILPSITLMFLAAGTVWRRYSSAA
jgi:hypothetical protein